MSNKGKEIVTWVVLAIGLSAIVAGIYGAVAQPGEVNKDAGSLVIPVTATNQAKGSEVAKVVIVEYSDFECPACGYFYGMIKKLGEEKGDAVQIVYRHFPLAQHRYARMAAQAAEAAGVQGKFWEMHDVLFERQKEWSKSENIEESLIGYADLIRLDKAQFTADLQRPEIGKKIDQDVALGMKQKIQGTPTFFLNGEMVQFRSYEDLQRLVDAELNK